MQSIYACLIKWPKPLRIIFLYFLIIIKIKVQFIPDQPNIIFILCDDCNDYEGVLLLAILTFH